MMDNVQLLLPEIEKAAQVLKKDGVVIFPTDTVYGVGCIFDNKKAVERIYRMKKRDANQQFPNLVSEISQVEKEAEITPLAQNLIDTFWPGGLTIILKKKNSKEKIAFRMPNSWLIKSLITQAGKPIIGTSANFHGEVTPKSFKELNPEFTKQADFVLEGECQLAVESTIVDATGDSLKIIRQGAVNVS
mgnify:FL=1